MNDVVTTAPPARRAVSAAVLFSSVLWLACSGEPSPDDPGGSGGAGASSVAGGGAGGVPSTTGGMTNAGMSTGGAKGGTPSAGGAGGGGAGGATAGSGGATAGSGGATAGSGGMSGGGAGGGPPGGKPPANPSAGCNKANPQTGSSGSPLTVSGHQYYVKLPTGYDPAKPYPTMIMFNPTNNPISWAETSAGFEVAGPKDNWIRVYPHPANSSSGWGSGDVSFFAPLYEQITASYCIDKARVFASGESSGGDFSSILGCEHADKLRAIGPCATKNVQQYPLNAETRKCTGQVTAVVIHGKMDNVVGPENGPKTRDFYVALNKCDATTKPVTGYTDNQSNCVQYDGCDPNRDVYWCQHSDPNYSNTNHGWPKFAGKFLYELFSTY
jgi:polyhydroxybutyrate depolymerase